MSEKKTFLVPVVVDDTSERGASVPERFREVQWSRLPAGQTTPAFVSRIMALLAQMQTTVAAQPQAPPGSAALPPHKTRRAAWPLLVLALAVLTAGGVWLLRQQAHTTVPAAPPSAPPQVTTRSIAVLPFVDMSEKHDQEYFSDGLSEELIDVLTKLPGLRVPARTSSFSFKGKSYSPS
jgi:hypothetical protein